MENKKKWTTFEPGVEKKQLLMMLENVKAGKYDDKDNFTFGRIVGQMFQLMTILDINNTDIRLSADIDIAVTSAMNRKNHKMWDEGHDGPNDQCNYAGGRSCVCII